MRNMVEPDGAKIRELRTAKGILQKQLGPKVGLSERTLRDIETRNKLIPEFTLNELAQKLDVEPNLIRAPKKPLTVVPFVLQQPGKENPYQLQLRPITNGSNLYGLISGVAKYLWDMDIDPTSETAPLMEETMKLVKRLVTGYSFGYDGYGGSSDEYDANYEFPDIYRRARIRNLIGELAEKGVQVLANTYTHRYKDGDDKIQVDRILRLSFCGVEVPHLMREIDPGLLTDPLDDPFHYTDPLDDPLDDEIPF
jgi:transcriptional regulator with XRE-family HTH domain